MLGVRKKKKKKDAAFCFLIKNGERFCVLRCILMPYSGARQQINRKNVNVTFSSPDCFKCISECHRL